MLKNLAANLFGRFWGVFSNFIFLPLYVKYLGVNQYGIISLALVITVFISLMDAGMTATITRELANNENDSIKKINIFRTLDSIYLIVALITSLSVFLFSTSIVGLINSEGHKPEILILCIKIIGIEIGFKLLSQFYSGGLLGLDKQIELNKYKILWGIFRNGFVVLVIIYSNSIISFLLWQCLVTIIYSFLIRLRLINILYQTIGLKNYFTKFKIDITILKSIKNYTLGMLLISIVVAINTQVDKLILSSLLSLEILAYYTLAFTLSKALNLIVEPIKTTVLPTIISLYTSEKSQEGSKIFKFTNYLICIIVFPISSLFIVYPEMLLYLWTNNMDVAKSSSIYLVPLTIGNLFLTIQLLPFNVAIANKFTKYNNVIGFVSLFVFVPGSYYLISLFGGLGSAYLYAFVQIIIAIIYTYLINRKFINLSLKELWFNPVIILITSLLFGYFVSTTLVFSNNRFIDLTYLGIIFLLSGLINLLIISLLDNVFKNWIKTKMLEQWGKIKFY